MADSKKASHALLNIIHNRTKSMPRRQLEQPDLSLFVPPENYSKLQLQQSVGSSMRPKCRSNYCVACFSVSTGKISITIHQHGFQILFCPQNHERVLEMNYQKSLASSFKCSCWNIRLHMSSLHLCFPNFFFASSFSKLEVKTDIILSAIGMLSQVMIRFL